MTEFTGKIGQLKLKLPVLKQEIAIRKAVRPCTPLTRGA